MNCILSVDPGTTHIGISILNNKDILFHTCYDISLDDSMYMQVHKYISFAIRKYNPDIVVIEGYRGRGQTQEIIGVIKITTELMSYEWFEVSPQEVKKCVTGKGNASKTQIINKINELYNLNLKNTHIADSIAIGHTYLKINSHPITL